MRRLRRYLHDRRYLRRMPPIPDYVKPPGTHWAKVRRDGVTWTVAVPDEQP